MIRFNCLKKKKNFNSTQFSPRDPRHPSSCEATTQSLASSSSSSSSSSACSRDSFHAERSEIKHPTAVNTDSLGRCQRSLALGSRSSKPLRQSDTVTLISPDTFFWVISGLTAAILDLQVISNYCRTCGAH